ncbi:GNAT family N-acetyltransferase [Vulgatibacter incomptus]|uniref:Acetyltransferase, GNAT family n=1 Tax=Vulgatibacter incomptus TaxID=1391653 RepID=A0A0K1PEP9_9BACT|nr:GNAT family N-acetyltransferase [Vulgatibacter incomptus]AKU91977.1 Acetyltransferase, GNAT family [Vulgatibacter incomptus]
MQLPPFSLRPVGPGDEPFLLAVYASTREEELRPVPWSDAEKEAFVRFQFEAQHKQYREHCADARFDVICVGDRPVGRLYVHRSAEEIRIIDIALLTAERGRGIGSALLERFLAESRETGVPVRIHVEKHNPAMRLYTRLGFVPIADRGVYLFLEWKARNDA